MRACSSINLCLTQSARAPRLSAVSFATSIRMQSQFLLLFRLHASISALSILSRSHIIVINIPLGLVPFSHSLYLLTFFPMNDCLHWFCVSFAQMHRCTCTDTHARHTYTYISQQWKVYPVSTHTFLMQYLFEHLSFNVVGGLSGPRNPPLRSFKCAATGQDSDSMLQR